MFHIPTDSETLLSSTYPLPTLCLRVLVFDSDVVPPPYLPMPMPMPMPTARGPQAIAAIHRRVPHLLLDVHVVSQHALRYKG